MSKEKDIYNGVIVYRRLLTYVKPYWAGFIFAGLAMGVFAALEAGMAFLMQPLLDGGFVNKDPYIIKLIPGAIILIAVLRGVSGFVSTYGINWVGRGVTRDLRSEMFTHLLHSPTSYYDQSSSGHLLSTLNYNAEQVSQAASNAVTVLIRDSLTMIFLLGVLFYRSWILTLVFIIVIPLIALIMKHITKRFRKISHGIQQSVGDITHVAEEAIEGHKVVKVFGGQQYEDKTFKKVNNNNRRQVLKMEAAKAIGLGLLGLVASIGLAGVIYFATHGTMRDSISPGEFVSFVTALIWLNKPIRRLMTVNAYIQKGIAGAQSIFALLDSEKEKDTGTMQVENINGEIEYKNVSFTYDEKHLVLKDISLHIEAGHTAAFVGKSGSGKSTLVSLLTRFYDVETGEITLDGQNINSLTLDCLRNQVALVSQHVTLFNDSIRNNIAYGTLNQASEDDIIHAARMAHAMEFIDRYPEGLDTLVGENGVLLSGGQRQRLAIARALLKDAPVLILDEATSSLDTESERYIQSALEELMKNRTTLIVAHRLSTIEKADIIYALDNGHIVESGTHQQLLEQNGHYARLYHGQHKL